MKLGMVAVLLLIDFTTSVVDDRRVSCCCYLHKLNYKQINVDCGFNSTSPQEVSKKRDLTCSEETTGFVPHGYEFVPGVGVYKLYRTGGTYEKAVVQCQQDGAFLAVPKSRIEAQAIVSILKRNPAVRESFIGINDLDKTGTFRSVQGVPISSLGYNQWSPGQPDNSGPVGETCVTINPDGFYNDNRCDKVFAFVCQRPMSPLPPTGYKYLPQLGFYKHYLQPETYEGAKQRCLDDGGHLAVLDSQAEAEELVKYYDINTNVKESYIGLNDMAEEGVFVSETGKPVTSLGFANWYTGEPNNANTPWGENCVTFYVAGTMNDVVCTLKYPFFCEIPLPSK